VTVVAQNAKAPSTYVYVHDYVTGSIPAVTPRYRIIKNNIMFFGAPKKNTKKQINTHRLTPLSTSLVLAGLSLGSIIQDTK
jgi:hypothetical protein